MTYCLDTPNSFQIFGAWLYDWQTLISGLLALAAAWWAGRLITKQIQQTYELSQDERTRKFLAARCLMSLHLAEISNYCDRVFRSLKSLPKTSEVDLELDRNLENDFQFPNNSIEFMTNMLQFSSDISLIRIIGKIINEMQILKSRIRDIRSYDNDHFGNQPSSIEIFMIQAAEISVLVSSLFDFARQETDIPPSTVTWDTVESRLTGWLLSKSDRAHIWRYISNKKATGPVFECAQ